MADGATMNAHSQSIQLSTTKQFGGGSIGLARIGFHLERQGKLYMTIIKTAKSVGRTGRTNYFLFRELSRVRSKVVRRWRA
jgi:hypothetical protein